MILFSIWTRVTDSISYDNNRYAFSASIHLYTLQKQ